jgi:hypothetical protein
MRYGPFRPRVVIAASSRPSGLSAMLFGKMSPGTLKDTGTSGCGWRSSRAFPTPSGLEQPSGVAACRLVTDSR